MKPDLALAMKLAATARLAQPATRLDNPATAAAKAAVVCVMRTGGQGARRYCRDHALWLYRQARRAVLNPRWEFVCLTDDAELLAQPPPGPFRAVPLRSDWPGWWAKIEAFRPGLFPSGQEPDGVLFLDLDTVLRHPFWIPAAKPGVLRLLKGFTRDRAEWESGVMLWHGADPDIHAIHADYARHGEAYQWYCHGNWAGDQMFIAMSRMLTGRELAPVNELLDVVRFDQAHARPAAPIVPWFGMSKPWTNPAGFTPALAPSAAGVAMIGAWFSTMNDPARLAAAREGIRHWTALNPRPRILVLDASPGDVSPFADLDIELRRIPVHPENEALWQKETLWNLAAWELLDSERPPEALLFADLDVWWPGCPEVASLVADSCREHDFLQPFSQVMEQSPDGRQTWFPSYSYSKARGRTNIGEGQGFTWAMSTRWFRAVGGIPDQSIEGGGDAVACLRWDAGCVHGTAPRQGLHDWLALTRSPGPRTPWTCLPLELRHEWHGPRGGPGDTRHYVSRYYVWELCGGRRAVAERDERNGLWRWRDTPEASATRWVRLHQATLKTPEAVRQAYETALDAELAQRPAPPSPA